MAPRQKVCCSLSTQSSSPMSSSSRQTARAFSSSVSQLVVRGKLGRSGKARKAMKMVAAPSMMKSQRQALKPRAPSMFPVMPAEIKPEKAPEMSAPEYRNAVRRPVDRVVLVKCTSIKG